MSEAKTRYNRSVEIIDFQVKPLTRYERFDRVFTTVLKEVLAGSELKADAKGKRIHISLGTKGTWEYPTFELGIRTIGDLLENNIGAGLDTIEGECPGIDPIDQELLRGSFLSASAFGGKVKICWIRSLPAQEIGLKSGGTHRITQKGVRTLIQDESNFLELIRAGLAAQERIEKGSTLARHTE
jgi:hypothetical protein